MFLYYDYTITSDGMGGKAAKHALGHKRHGAPWRTIPTAVGMVTTARGGRGE
jgi:hypothetical protein